MTTYKLVVFDMDGIIFEHKNFWLELHKKLGTYEEGEALTRTYLKKDYERLVREVPGKLWKGNDATPYFELINSVKYKLGAQHVLKELRRRGLKTAIITSGPNHLALRAQQECGLDYFVSHELEIGPDNLITGAYHYTHTLDKTEELKQLISKAGCTLAETVFVGHGHNDVNALKAAGLGIACEPDDEEVARAAKRVIHELAELLDLFEA